MHEPPPWDPDPDALPRVLSRQQAEQRGISSPAVDRRVAAGRWRRILPRVYLTADTCTDHDRLVAAVLFAGRGSLLSGAGGLHAAQVARMPVPAQLLVLVPQHLTTASWGFVTVRRSLRPLVQRPWIGPPHVEVARAASDLAVTMTRLDDVRTLVARLVQHGHCTLPELAHELAIGPRRGSKFLRQALDEVTAGAASAPEAEAASILHAAGITGFTQNARLMLPDATTRVVDLYWQRLRACLEIDSVEYHFDRREWSGTWDRHLDLSKFGYSVIHRPPSALRDPARFARDVSDWLAGREADLRRGLA